MFKVSSTRMAETVVITACKWYFNGTEIVDPGTRTVKAEFASIFKILGTDGAENYLGSTLQVIGNFAQKAGFASPVIKVEAEVTKGPLTDKITKTMQLSVSKGSQESEQLVIYSKTGSMSIQGVNDHILLAAKFQERGLNTNEQVKWYRLDGGAWVQYTASSSIIGKDLKLVGEDIATTENVKCEVTNTDTGKINNVSVQVFDATDPYFIECEIVNSETHNDSLTITERDSTITFTPHLYNFDKTGKKTAITSSFYFSVTDANGVLLNSDSTTAKASGQVTGAMCEQAGTGATMTIEDA
jgi:hypothetical protein